MGKYLGILVILFLPIFSLAGPADYDLSIILSGEARFVLEFPDGSQYGSTKSEIISPDDSYLESFSADRQTIFLDSLPEGEYVLVFDSYRDWEFQIEFGLFASNYSNSRIYHFIPIKGLQNTIEFSVSEEGVLFADTSLPPESVEIEKKSEKTNLSWSPAVDAEYYSVFYRPDLFPFYRVLATTTSTFLETGHEWSDYSRNPDFPDNLYSYRIVSHYQGGQHSFLSTAVSNNDEDGDRITDIDEIAAGTDPTESDSDGDGLSDFIEQNRTYTDPLVTDTDGDGFSDSEENNARTIGIDATSAPSEPDGTCAAPEEGDWFVTTWCSITENQFVDQNLILLKGAYLVIRENIKIFVDFVNHNVQLRPGSKIDVEDGASISPYPN